VVHTAVETSRPLIDSGRHELSVALPLDPVYLDADPVRLAQVFSNLLNNAATYTAAGGHIRLSGERQGSDVVVSVKDDGAGIAAEMLPHIFDIFWQETRILERAQGGLGIGLSLVRALAKLHGGSVEARSDGPGKGSEFIVRLPTVAEKPIQMAAPHSEHHMRVGTTKHRILIVDDLSDNADSLAMLMKMTGYEVHAAYDGEEAIIAAAAFRPDVILLDIGIPKVNGYDVCRNIREQEWGKDVLMIALTGWGQQEDRAKSMQAGFNAHLVKPVDYDALLKLLALRSDPGEHQIQMG